MVFPSAMWILLAVSLIMCCMGFYRFVWFMSVGYGLSAAGIGAALLIMALVKGNISVIFALECVIMVIYGIRLGGFIFFRELKNASYREKLRQVGGETKVPVFVACVMWIVLGALYIMQSAGPVYRLLNGETANPGVLCWTGTVVAAVGCALEGIADRQKSEQKKTAPDMPATKGLYSLCRCPNYFGEMLFWLGIFASGISTYQGWQWVIAILGLVAIEYIMVSGAKRVETRHIKNYGAKPEYNKYADSVPLLIPFVPIYHMTSPEIIAAEEAKKAAKKAAKGK